MVVKAFAERPKEEEAAIETMPLIDLARNRKFESVSLRRRIGKLS